MAEHIWTSGRVPHGYWRDRRNRITYLRWLGRRLNFRTAEQWHGLTRSSFIRNFGAGLLATIYGDSPIAALRDIDPHHDWKPWLMASTPQRYWKNRANRVRYMRWLGKQLGYRKPADWLALTGTLVKQHSGGGLLHNVYRGSILKLLRDTMPAHDWKPWLVHTAPQGFWRKRANRRDYMLWLGKSLGNTKPEQWYSLSSEDFVKHSGQTLLMTFYGNSPTRAVLELLPELQLKPWLFARVPRAHWDSRSNRRAFVQWIGQELGIEKPEDWNRLTINLVHQRGGGAMLSGFYGNSITRMLRDCLGIKRNKPHGPVPGTNRAPAPKFAEAPTKPERKRRARTRTRTRERRELALA